MSTRAAELMRRIEDDRGKAYPLASERSEAYKKAMEMFLASGNHEQANIAKIEWLVFAFQETDKHEPGAYFGPRFTGPGKVPFPDFYELPPHTREYLKARVDATSNPIHRARYADFLWDKFQDAEAGPAAVTAYIDCIRLYNELGDSNSAFRAARRACHLATKFGNAELRRAVKEAAVKLIAELVTQADLGFVRKVGDALTDIGDLLEPEERKMLIERFEHMRASFVSVRNYFLERATLKVLRQVYKLDGDSVAERRAWLQEGESYEAEGDYKLKLDGTGGGPGGGPVVASHLYQLALDHFMQMGETAKVESLQKKLKEAYALGPANYQQFVEGLRGVPGGSGTQN
ncbi:MAG TPA: hypothetical protein DGR79_00115 [Clostridiales bacterium]|nr:hypothetical protein [Clostridiales bacterium]